MKTSEVDVLVEEALAEAFSNKPKKLPKYAGEDHGAPYNVYADIGYNDDDDDGDALLFAKKMAQKYGLRWADARSEQGESSFPSVYGSFDALDKAAAFYADCYEQPTPELDLEAGEDGGTDVYYTPQ